MTGPVTDLLRKALALPEEGSTMAARIDTLHFFVIGATMIGAVGVAVVTAYFLFRYAQKKPNEPTPYLRTSPWATVAKVFGPLSLFLLFWVIGFKQYVALETPPEGAMDVYVTAKQWMWKFAYANGPTSISTLVVPVHKPVRLVMTSRDVIHSFYVPAFRIKQDVLPGRYTAIWFEATKPGTYDIFCAEYCGTSHSGMKGKVVVLEEADFAAWIETQAPLGAPLVDDREGGGVGQQGTMAAYGAEVARRKQCLACHTVDGQKHIGPTWRGLYQSKVPLEGGRTVTADEAYLTRSMMLPAADVHEGFPPVMPTYEGRLKVEEVGALVEYIKSLREGSPVSVVTLPVVSVGGGPQADAGAAPMGSTGQPIPPLATSSSAAASAAPSASASLPAKEPPR